MKNHILTLLFFTTTFLSAQEEKPLPLVEKKQWKINFLYPGVSYEYGLGKKTTLYSSLSLIPASHSDNKQFKYWTVAPNIQEEFRYYYNLEKKARKNKRIAGNTGNYFSLQALYGLPPLGQYDRHTKIDGLTIAPTWGFQYTYKSGFNIGGCIGFGYNFSTHPSVKSEQFVNYLTIGWVLK